jgi:glutamate racemase
VDSAAATASALAELLSINDIQAPTGGTTHQQLTTGDVEAFRAVAQRMFGERFPDVAGVELEAGVPVHD